MSETPSTYFLTTPIYYVNARPHIGHAYTTIVADVLARRHRLLGDETFFLTGTDEHGQKIERSALAAGVPPQEFADHVSLQFRALWDRMGLTYDRYIRTTDPDHKVGAQKLFATLYERGFISLASYTGQYCVSDEAFVDVAAGEPCPDCGRTTETLTEENFFFKLSAFQQPLIELIESKGLVISPESARNEVLSFVRGGLKDLSISRSSFTWGIPVPEPAASQAAQRHVIYVWLDALANYMSALGYGSEDESLWQKFWPADLHLVGKEITRFHCVYWPAFLLAAGIATPKAITANGWLLFDNAKMSKSKGNVVRTETILDAFGGLCPGLAKGQQDLFAADVLRYFLLREIPFGQDGTFSFEALVTRYNADLANGFGNLVSRTLTMVRDYVDGVVPGSRNAGKYTPPAFGTLQYENSPAVVADAAANFHSAFDQGAYTAALEIWTSLVKALDGYLSASAPWKLARDPERQRDLCEVLYTACEGIRIATALIFPVLPFTSALIWRQLGLGDIEAAARNSELKHTTWGGLTPGTKLGPLAPIFPRADKGLAKIMTDMETSSTLSPDSPKPDSPKPDTQKPGPSDPGAGPRTTTLAEPNPGAQVAGSNAETTERPGTPSHAEAAASGIFAGSQPGDASPQITIDDFAKVELRIAQVLVCERIPKADKLLRLEVDLGYEKRQILSGIAEWYTPEDLVGRRIVVITNLAPRKMRGLESHGMLIAASSEGGKPALATFLDSDTLPLGSRLK